jgi:signal transduction histidine kinase
VVAAGPKTRTADTEDLGNRLRERLHALQQAALIIAAPVPAEPGAVADLLSRIVELATDALGAADGAIVLADDPAWLDLVTTPGSENGLITLRRTGQPFRQNWRPEGTTRRVLATGEPIAVADTAAPSPFGTYPYLVESGIRSFYMVPLQTGGRVVGRLGLNFAAPGELPPEDREALALFAAHAAAALERVRLAHAQAAHAAAEAAVRARDEFLSIAAHELKTPITSLRGYAQFLLRRFEQSRSVDADVAARAIHTIDAQADKLSRLITQLLDVSRLEAGKLILDREPTDLVDLIRGVVDTVQARAGSRTIAVKAPRTPIVATVDPLRIEQVVANLLDNAVKHSLDTRSVDVRVWQPDAESVVFSVRDRGRGIPRHQHALVFERFYQVGLRMPHALSANGAVSAASATGAPEPRSAGMGLGLYISRQIVDRHGGTISLESPRSGGACFVVRLPLDAAEGDRQT